MRRVFLIALLISSLSLFSQQTESIDTLDAVYVTSESQIIELFYAARLNSYENYQLVKTTVLVIIDDNCLQQSYEKENRLFINHCPVDIM
jgi:hypothetical protein